MNMINGLKVKQWGFKFGNTTKESTKSTKTSVNGKFTSEKKVYQREVVSVNGATAGKASVVHEIKIKTENVDKGTKKAITKQSVECVNVDNKVKSVENKPGSKQSTSKPEATNKINGLILNGDVKHDNKVSNDNAVTNGCLVNRIAESESKLECDTDKVEDPGDACLGRVTDNVEIAVDSDISDDEDCLSDSHGINICHYKLKRMALDQNNMNHSKVHVDESEPMGYEEPPFESRDVKIRNGCWITDEYDISDVLLGRGKFGEVKQCQERKTGRDLAAKFIIIQGPQDRFDVINEIEMMKSLQHPRLLQLYDVFSKRNNFCLVLELISGGELFERVINDDFILTEKACIMFMRQICEGIEFMHNNTILHLDLKPENILCLTREGNRIKIIDFGLARKYDPKCELRILFGTPEFMAPEQANFEPIYPATDMWSVGIICYILLSGLSPFLGENENETIGNITEAKWDFNAEEFNSISIEAKDFISKLILKDNTKRLTATECLEHKWLRRSAKRERIPTRSLSTKRLRKFVYRRKWQKAVNAMLALKRMGVKL